MKLLIDADACPVVNIAVTLCSRFGVPCLLLCDTAHIIQKAGAETLVFDKGADSVDLALVNRVQPGDIVITQDYGLAAMCLAKGAKVINQDGMRYTDENIDTLLAQRAESAAIRRAGGRTKGPAKRTQEQNNAFIEAFPAMIGILYRSGLPSINT